MTQTTEGQGPEDKVATEVPASAVDASGQAVGSAVTESNNGSTPAEHVTSDADVAAPPSSDSQKSSPTDEGKTAGGRRRRQPSAKTAALLADPLSLLELEVVDETTKKSQCMIPFQRSTFLQVEGTPREPKTPTKSTYRYDTWIYMEKNNIAASPRPVTKRIPNFKDSDLACETVSEMPQFKEAKTVVIGPDRPQQKLRYFALKEGKTLLVPSSRLATGLFNKINPPNEATDEQINLCATSQGVRTFSTPVGLDDEVNVDLVIMGCSVVTRKGQRLGKGEGFADLEWAMMVSMGAVSTDTTVITCVHDCQIKDELPEDIFQEYDLPVDIIVSPTQTLMVETPLKKPAGIMWSKITERKMEKVPVLKQLREKEEAKGVDVTLAPKAGQNPDSVSYIKDDNEIDKSCQTNQARRSTRSFNDRNRRFSRRRQQRGNREGGVAGAPPLASDSAIRSKQGKYDRKKRSFNRERRREKSVTEDDGVVESNKASAGSGDAAANIAKKRDRQRKNQRRERSTRKREDSRRNANEQNADTEGGETSGKGEDNSGAEDNGGRPPRRNRNSRRNRRREESNRRLNSENEERSVVDNRGDQRRGGGGGRNRSYNGGYPPYDMPPWMYNMPPPHAGYGNRGGFYPPPGQMRSRYGYRNQGFFGPMPPPHLMGGGGGGRRGGPQGGGRGPSEFVPGASMKPAVFVGDIPEECGEEMFGDVLQDRKVRPTRMIWQKNENRTFLVFDSLNGAQDCVRKLKNLYINDEACRVDLSNMTKRNYYM